MIPPLNLRDRLPGQLRKPRGVEPFAGLHHIDQMMRHSLALASRGFGRPNVQAAVNLHGIDRDNLTLQPFGKVEGNGRFTHGRRPGQDDRHTLSMGFAPASERGSKTRSANPMTRIPALTVWPGVKKPPNVLVGRVVAAKHLDERPHQRIAHQVNRKDLAVELLAPEKPRQSAIQTQVQHGFIDLGGMHRKGWSLGGVVGGKANGPG